MSKPWWKKALDSGYYEKRGYVSEYGGAAGFVPAASQNFTEMSRSAGDIDRIVIHITGGTNVGSAINTFAAKNNSKKTSAHYVVSQDGLVYQMVKEKDRAHHAGSSANKRSIGIEHAASNKSGPTEEQYWASAYLVRYLAGKYSIPVDRTHILGHQEIATTDHNCPGPLWDWPNYIMKVYLANLFYWA
ncbi:N-acetylmuramoyl-L-alanine amidase [Tropicimonas sp. IMCC6043]|uniref:N-acetylmuramoyl-L-alanine amidase n=1 Tax=Tropicimonas sp. IMCC6043 TaxID=2510645 RepID=UPI00101DB57B|nr:peptidoglycan recognition family protein [Tropicimonas sp. IMCC6043]RYH06897.1 N-acetylmuramoyl-L-alanine amidase [Tropicimonas sp. IMCC6043]